MGISNTVNSCCSVWLTAVNFTTRSAPAAVMTCGGVNTNPTARNASLLMRPVDPEEAPASLPRFVNPACQPAGASRNKS